MKNIKKIGSTMKLVAIAVLVLGFGIAAGIFRAVAFNGPSSNAGSGAGTIGTDSAGDISIGTQTPIAGTKLLVQGSSTNSSAYSVQVVNRIGGNLLSIRNDGAVVVPGVFTAGTITATMNASNITSGQFGSGNFSFPSNLSVGTTSSAYALTVANGNIALSSSGAGIVFPDGSIQTTAASGTGGGSSQWIATASNTAVGIYALQSSSGTEFNSAFGSWALTNDNVGDDNSAIGNSALYSNTTGNANTANGSYSLYNNVSGSYNTADGQLALQGNTSGNYNVADGFSALGLAGTGGANVAVGALALNYASSLNSSTAVGYGALYGNDSGLGNSALGYEALASNLSGNDNVADGFQALGSNIAGGANTATGYQALYSLLGAASDTAYGYQAMGGSGLHFYGSTAIGYQAGYRGGGGAYNTAIGYQSGYNGGLAQNTSIGYQSLYRNQGGSDDTAAGSYALANISTASDNTAVGAYALGNQITGGQNTAIGSGAGGVASSSQGGVYLGYDAGLQETGSNKLYIANSSTTSPLIYGDFANGFLTINGNLNVSGTITATTKNFEIPYPGGTKPGYDLVHSSLEGPENGVFYRGTATLANGQATVTLPSYFAALTRAGSETVSLTAKGTTPFSLSYDSFSHDAGTFIVHGTLPSGQFDWQVVATRADVPALQVIKPTPTK